MTQLHEPTAEARERRYYFAVDGREFDVETPTITGAEIMRLAGIPADQGLILIAEDGTQRAVTPSELFELEPGKHFKKQPHFRRG